MEIKEMSMQDIETRSLEIEELMKSDDANIDELKNEVDELEARKAEIIKEAEARKAEIDNVVKEAEVVEEFNKEEVRQKMELKELRNTKEYQKAYAEYVLSGYKNDTELRKVLTANAADDNVGENDTTYPVPELLMQKVQTAWDNDEIMSRITKTYLKGNVKIGFEISGTDAVIHAEGSAAPAEEKLVLGTVSLIPNTFKKWIRVSTEQYEMGGEMFMDYIYDEIAYRIVKKMASEVINVIKNSPATSSDTAPAVAVLTQALGAGTIVSAEALLSDEATDVVAIMNRATWGALKALQITSGTNVGDVFDGKTVLFNNDLPAYADATANQTYMIVGDLKAVQGNYPNGDEIKFVFDEKSEAEADLVKIVGRLYGALGVIRPNAFTQVKKAA